VIAARQANPTATQAEIAEISGVSLSTVRRIETVRHPRSVPPSFSLGAPVWMVVIAMMVAGRGIGACLIGSITSAQITLSAQDTGAGTGALLVPPLGRWSQRVDPGKRDHCRWTDPLRHTAGGASPEPSSDGASRWSMRRLPY
jgi:hypothetical protein